MAIEVVCVCGQKLKAPDGFAGRRVRCPACKVALAIPRPMTTPGSTGMRPEAADPVREPRPRTSAMPTPSPAPPKSTREVRASRSPSRVDPPPLPPRKSPTVPVPKSDEPPNVPEPSTSEVPGPPGLAGTPIAEMPNAAPTAPPDSGGSPEVGPGLDLPTPTPPVPSVSSSVTTRETPRTMLPAEAVEAPKAPRMPEAAEAPAALRTVEEEAGSIAPPTADDPVPDAIEPPRADVDEAPESEAVSPPIEAEDSGPLDPHAAIEQTETAASPPVRELLEVIEPPEWPEVAPPSPSARPAMMPRPRRVERSKGGEAASRPALARRVRRRPRRGPLLGVAAGLAAVAALVAVALRLIPDSGWDAAPIGSGVGPIIERTASASPRDLGRSKGSGTAPRPPKVARFEAPPSPRAAVGPLIGSNLILNGGAEEAGAIDDGPVGAAEFASWERLGFVARDAFEGAPVERLPAFDGVGDAFGASYFRGGLPEVPGEDRTILRQAVDVSPLADRIDAGGVGYALSGWIGGRNEARSFEPNDGALLSVRFLDDSGAATRGPSGMASIGPADDGLLQSRPGSPDLMAPASTSGSVPNGTRSIVFELTFRRRIGAAIDATADRLAFVLDDAEVP